MANLAKTTLTEKDLTQVADSQSGVPVGLVFPTKRGTVSTARLNADVNQLLRKYTRNGKKIDISDPEGLYHAESILEDSQEVWTSRAVNNATYCIARAISENYNVAETIHKIIGFTVDINFDWLTLATTFPLNQNRGFRVLTDGTLPVPLALNTDYFFKVLENGKVKVYDSLVNLQLTPKTATLNTGSNIVNITAHGFTPNQPIYFDSGALTPANIDRYKTYYVAVLGANDLYLLDAPAGNIVNIDSTVLNVPTYYNFVDFSSTGTGNHSISASVNLDTEKTAFNGTMLAVNDNKILLDTEFIAKLYTGSKINFDGANLPNPLLEETDYFSVVNPLNPTYISVAKSKAEALSKPSRFTVSTVANTINTDIITGMETGQPVRILTTGVSPSADISGIAPLDLSTTYYLVKISPKVFKLAISYANATAPTPITIDIVGGGIGVHTVIPRYIDFTTLGSGTNYCLTRNNTENITTSYAYVDLTNNRLVISPILGNRLVDNSIIKLSISVNGTLPAPTDNSTDYYVKKISPSEIKLCDVPDGTPLTLLDVGQGTITVTNSPIVSEPSSLDQGDDDTILFFNKDQGEWGKDYYLRLTDNRENVENSFVISIFHKDNAIVPREEFVVSRVIGQTNADGDNIYINDVLDSSEIIGAISNPLLDQNIFPLCNEKLFRLNGGSNGNTVTDSDMILSLQQAFGNPALLLIKVFLDAGFNVPSYQRALNAMATFRGNAVALHGTPFSEEKSADYMNRLVDFRKVDLALDSSYSMLYTPHVKIKDKYNNRNIFISSESYGARAICFSKRNFEIFYPPAGLTRGKINVEGLFRYFLDGELEVLARNQINAVKFDLANSTNVIWDQQTLLSIFSMLQSGHIRLMVNEIKTLAKPLLDRFIFELNDELTRDIAKSKIDAIGEELKRKRGLFDYRTVADKTNNTNIIISQKKLVIDFYITPVPEVREINFTVILLNPGFSINLGG
jgi:hypothetical protein